MSISINISMMKNAATTMAAFCLLSATAVMVAVAQPNSNSATQAPAPVRDAMQTTQTTQTTKPPAASPAPAITVPTASQAPASVAAQFASIGDKPAIVYDALSNKANKIFILTRQQPVEILVKLDKWVKIRDAENTIGWIESSALDKQHRTQVNVGVADIRAMANPTSSLVFEAQRAVILDVIGPVQDGWLPVRHRDGQAGFVRKNQVWGE